ncbi:MAG TPA: transposase, partial [Candidatus Saccharimonadia bacterium]|nr:transposase [Candidatus Saccharimonadia bacterium]
GISTMVVNPASIAVTANNQVKTDRRDSKKLAIDLADGRLRGISVPTEAEERARLLSRTRAQVVEHRATIARQIKATLYRSVPGIGEAAARTFATELGDMTRFADERALFSSTGLTPSAYASGVSVRRGPLSHQGSSRVRTESTEGGAMYRLREGSSFFLANSHNRRGCASRPRRSDA